MNSLDLALFPRYLRATSCCPSEWWNIRSLFNSLPGIVVFLRYFCPYVNFWLFHSCWPFRFACLSFDLGKSTFLDPFIFKNILSFLTSFAYWSLFSGNPCAHMVNTNVFSCNCCFIHPSCRIFPIWPYFMFDYSNIFLWSDNNAMSQLSQVCIWNYLILLL